MGGVGLKFKVALLLRICMSTNTNKYESRIKLEPAAIKVEHCANDSFIVRYKAVQILLKYPPKTWRAEAWLEKLEAENALVILWHYATKMGKDVKTLYGVDGFNEFIKAWRSDVVPEIMRVRTDRRYINT